MFELKNWPSKSVKIGQKRGINFDEMRFTVIWLTFAMCPLLMHISMKRQ